MDELGEHPLYQLSTPVALRHEPGGEAYALGEITLNPEVNFNSIKVGMPVQDFYDEWLSETIYGVVYQWIKFDDGFVMRTQRSRMYPRTYKELLDSDA